MANEQGTPLMTIIEDEKEKEKYAKQLANMDTGKDKKYLILFAAYVDNSYDIQFKEWEYATGRQKAYDLINEYFHGFSSNEYNQSITFDAFKSRIIVQSSSGVVPIDGISVYKFIKTMVERDLVIPDSAFDIEEWNPGNETEEEEN